MQIVQAKPADSDRSVRLATSKAKDVPVVHLDKHGARKVWDNHEVIAEVTIDHTHRIKITAGTVNGFRFVDLREFLYYATYDAWRPTKKGIRIPIQMPVKQAGSKVPVICDVGEDFLKEFVKAFEVAKNMELYNRDNAVYILKKTIMKETSTNED
jgi:hypothetical protein